MSGFSSAQVQALSKKLDRSHVQVRKTENGRELSYVEGWFVIKEANAIFGFAGWDRESVHFERVFERNSSEGTSCAYLTRMRLKVRAGESIVTREGTGFGSAYSKVRAEAHERAIKAAETDATKRALATFGNRFGLALYDKDQAGVTDEIPLQNSWTIFDLDGAPFIEALSAESFCSALRQIVEQRPAGELSKWRDVNRVGLEHLRTAMPQLKTAKGSHYADILLKLIERRLLEARENGKTFSKDKDPKGPLAPSKIAPGLRIDKSTLLISTERRVRDKAYLKSISFQACLICGRQPSHAHHLTFAQMRGLSQKVSDEFVVPLCALHHGELHRFGHERDWWEKKGVDPLPIAMELWARNRQLISPEPAIKKEALEKDPKTHVNSTTRPLPKPLPLIDQL